MSYTQLGTTPPQPLGPISVILGLGVGEGDGDAAVDAPAELVGEGVALADGSGEGVALADGVGETLGDGAGSGEGVAEGSGLVDGLGDAASVGVGAGACSSAAATAVQPNWLTIIKLANNIENMRRLFIIYASPP